MRERTLAMVKPDAVGAGHVGAILGALEAGGFAIVELRMLRMDPELAKEFYGVHRDRPFFPSLIRFITSGPVVAMVLEAEDAIRRLREAMGATDPARAPEGTIRRRFGSSLERNAIHGSDSSATAAFEIRCLFPGVGATSG